MLLRITVHDNDFTKELEEFAADPTLTSFYCTTSIPEYSSWEATKKMQRARELFFGIEKYTPELITELLTTMKEHWRIFITHIMTPHPWWSVEDEQRIKKYLIDNCEIKFQRSLAPKWENGEVVYICLGYPNRWWTF